MRGTVRGFVVGAATALVVVPFVAIAQEAPPEPPELPDVVPDDVPEVVPDEATVAEADPGLLAEEAELADIERPEGAGPPWYDGEPWTGEGPPPWAPAHGYRAQLEGWQGGGPPPSVGADRSGGRPFEGDGPPPWAGRGGPHGAARAGSD